MDNQNSDNDIR